MLGDRIDRSRHFDTVSCGSLCVYVTGLVEVANNMIQSVVGHYICWDRIDSSIRQHTTVSCGSLCVWWDRRSRHFDTVSVRRRVARAFWSAAGFHYCIENLLPAKLVDKKFFLSLIGRQLVENPLPSNRWPIANQLRIQWSFVHCVRVHMSGTIVQIGAHCTLQTFHVNFANFLKCSATVLQMVSDRWATDRQPFAD